MLSEKRPSRAPSIFNPAVAADWIWPMTVTEPAMGDDNLGAQAQRPAKAKRVCKWGIGLLLAHPLRSELAASPNDNLKLDYARQPLNAPLCVSAGLHAHPPLASS